MNLKSKHSPVLKKVSLLSDAQHGFVPRRLCPTKLIIAEELTTGMTDQGEPVDVVYLDFSLFLILINDLADELTCNYLFFADDVKLITPM